MGNYGSVNVPGVSGPELEAVRAIANSALEKANEALEGGGGSGCVLKITFDADFAGQQYTVTDGAGDTKTGTVPEGLVDSVSVKNCNTEYTVSASTASGEQYSATVTTGAYFGQYEVTLGRVHRDHHGHDCPRRGGEGCPWRQHLHCNRQRQRSGCDLGQEGRQVHGKRHNFRQDLCVRRGQRDGGRRELHRHRQNPHCGHPVSGRELDLHWSGADPHGSTITTAPS